MKKFQNKYRIPSARLQTWDYRRAGAYFITICTCKRIHYFGEIKNGVMNLSEIGVLANRFWYEIPNHCRNVELGAFVVMPDHIHGVLVLNAVETGHAPSLPISSIIGGYKSAVSKHARLQGFEFAWQPRFYDHIIRNDESFRNINDYIINNPANWGKKNPPTH